MRKLIVSMNVTLDGYMSGPDCGLDWHFQSWTSDMAKSACEQLRRADTILLGRITYSAMAGYWPNRATSLFCPREDIAFADMMNQYTKVVFSKTLKTLSWQQSRLVTGEMAEEINRLKAGPGKDMIVYGSGELVTSMIELALVDEYRIWVHPVLLGNGRLLFKPREGMQQLKLLGATIFSSGVVVFYYEVIR